MSRGLQDSGAACLDSDSRCLTGGYHCTEKAVVNICGTSMRKVSRLSLKRLHTVMNSNPDTVSERLSLMPYSNKVRCDQSQITKQVLLIIFACGISA